MIRTGGAAVHRGLLSKVSALSRQWRTREASVPRVAAALRRGNAPRYRCNSACRAARPGWRVHRSFAERPFGVVQRAQRRAVADADDRRRRQRRAQPPVQPRFRRFVERRCRLVEEHPVGPVQQHARELQPLLLARRQHRGPVERLVQAGAQARQFRLHQRLHDRALVERIGRLRPGQRGGQRADRQVRSLRHEHQRRAVRQRDAAIAAPPEPGDRAQQRCLAAARRPGDEHMLSASQAPARYVQQLATVGRLDAQRAQLDRVALLVAALDHALRQRLRRAIGVRREPRQALDGGAPVGEAGVGVDEPAQRTLHLAERLRGLHQAAELQPAGEVARRRGEHREHVGELPIAGREPREPLGGADQRVPVRAHRIEHLRQALPFARFARCQRHRLGMVAHLHERVAEVGFDALLLHVQAHERQAEPLRDPAAERGVGDRDPDHVAGHVDAARPERDGERARQAPQDADERDQRHARVQQAERQLQARADEAAGVLRDALVGVVDCLCLLLREPVRRARLEPALQQVVRQPRAPAHQQALLQVLTVHGGNDEARGEQREDAQLVPEAGEVVVLQRVVEAVVPLAEAYVEPDAGERQRHHRAEQRPRAALAAVAPERHRQRPCIAQAGGALVVAPLAAEETRGSSLRLAESTRGLRARCIAMCAYDADQPISSSPFSDSVPASRRITPTGARSP